MSGPFRVNNAAPKLTSQAKEYDAAVVRGLDPRYFTADYDPISDVLSEININIDFSLPASERVKHAFSDTNTRINAEDLQLPPPPSFFENSDGTTPLRDMLGSPRINSDSHVLEQALHRLEQTQQSVDRVLGSRVLTHSGRFLAGLTQVTRVSHEVGIASDIAKDARAALAEARTGLGAASVALAARERARARARAVEALLSAARSIVGCEAEARRRVAAGDISGAVELLSEAQHGLLEEGRTEVLQRVACVGAAVARLDHTESVVLDMCLLSVEHCVDGDTAPHDVGRALRAVIMQGSPHLVGEIIGKGLCGRVRQLMRTAVSSRLEQGWSAQDGNAIDEAEAVELEVGSGCENARIGRRLEPHTIREVMRELVECGKRGLHAARQLEGVVCAMLARYTALAEEMRIEAEAEAASGGKGRGHKHRGKGKSSRSRHAGRDGAASEGATGAEDWVQELSGSDFSSYTLEPAETTPGAAPRSASSTPAASVSRQVDAALEDLRYSLSQVRGHRLAMMLDVAATLCSVCDCRRVGGKSSALSGPDVGSVVEDVHAWTTVAVAVLRSRAYVALDEAEPADTAAPRRHSQSHLQAPCVCVGLCTPDCAACAAHAPDDNGDFLVVPTEPSTLDRDDDDLNSFLGDDAPPSPSSKSHSLSQSLSMHDTAAPPCCRAAEASSSTVTHLVELSRRLCALAVARVREHLDSLVRSSIEYTTMVLVSDTLRPLPVRAAFDVETHVPELRLKQGRSTRVDVAMLQRGGDGAWRAWASDDSLLQAWERDEDVPDDVFVEDEPVSARDVEADHRYMMQLVAPLVYHAADSELYTAPAPESWTARPPPDLDNGEVPIAALELHYARIATRLGDPTLPAFPLSAMGVVRTIGRVLRLCCDMGELAGKGAETVSTVVRMYIYNVTTLLGAPQMQELFDTSTPAAREAAEREQAEKAKEKPKDKEKDTSSSLRDFGSSMASKFSLGSKFSFPLSPNKDRDKKAAPAPEQKPAEQPFIAKRRGSVAGDARAGTWSPLPLSAFTTETHLLPLPSAAVDATAAERMPWLSHLLRGVKYEVEQGTFADGLFVEKSIPFIAAKAAQEAMVASSSSSLMSPSGSFQRSPSISVDKTREKAQEKNRFSLTGLRARVQRSFHSEAETRLANAGIPPPILGELSPMVDVTSRDAVYGFSERMIAVRGLFFLAQALRKIHPRFAALLPADQAQTLHALCIECYGCARDAALLLTDTVASAIAQNSSLRADVAKVNWSMKTLASAHHPYVGALAKSLAELRSNTLELPGAAAFWSHTCRVLLYQLLDAAGAVKQWSPEGRSALALDVSMLRIALEQQLPVRPLSGLSCLNEVVAAFHYPPQDFLRWVRQGALRLGLSRAQIEALARSGPLEKVEKANKSTFQASLTSWCNDNEERLHAAAARYEYKAGQVRETLVAPAATSGKVAPSLPSPEQVMSLEDFDRDDAQPEDAAKPIPEEPVEPAVDFASVDDMP